MSKNKNAKPQSMRDRLRKRSKLGFSLVELIVVIAIMAVLATVLVPSLLSYVERSRAQRDHSAMDEVTNAVMLAITDFNAYDELLEYSIKDNVSCYIDRPYESEVSEHKLVTQEATSNTAQQYTFGDAARAADETIYYAAGNMRGVTITFEPSSDGKASTYALDKAVFNKFAPTDNADKLTECPELYNRIRAIVGNEIEQISQTYRNSEYTVFIRLGTIGGGDVSEQDMVDVYGQYSGTSLPITAPDKYLVAGGRELGGGSSSADPVTPSNQPPTVGKLQETYKFEYYSTVMGAITDVNSSAVGSNADANKDNAVAGIYTDENGDINVVLLKDATEAAKIAPSKNMIINLGGHRLSANANVVIDITGGTVVIDGRLQGSAIEANAVTGQACAIQARAGNVTIDGGTYIANATGTMAAISVQSMANLTASNAKFEAHTESGKANGMKIVGNAATIYNCDIAATAKDTGPIWGFNNTKGYVSMVYCTIAASIESGGEAQGVRNEKNITMSNCDVKSMTNHGQAAGMTNIGTATLTNCEVLAYDNHLYDEESGEYIATSTGIFNTTGSAISLNNCHVYGNHSGVAGGNITIDGGIYEGYAHGGIYFSRENSTSYVKNAIIRECAMPDGYTANNASNGAGFYIGSGSNITVRMDNCDIYGSNRQIAMRDTAGETNNALYISNSQLYDLDGNDIKVRVDNDTCQLHIGAGNNFTIDNVMSYGNKVPDFTKNVFTTNETYTEK